jgi:hypothetical protein
MKKTGIRNKAQISAMNKLFRLSFFEDELFIRGWVYSFKNRRKTNNLFCISTEEYFLPITKGTFRWRELFTD